MEGSMETNRIELPVLPLRDVVVYPHMVIPLFVGRDRSIKALDIAMAADKQILLIAQKSPDVDDPGQADLYPVGTLANVLQLLKLPDGTIKVLVEGISRVAIEGFGDKDGRLTATGATLESNFERDEREMAVTLGSLMSLFEQYVKTNRKLPPELLTTLAGIDDAGRVADTIAAHLGARLADKQRLLETARRRPAPGSADRPGGRRDRRAADREAHPRPREVADGAQPARVLPQRADEGDPEGTRRPRRGAERDRGARQEDRRRRHAQGGGSQGARRIRQAQADVADVGRSHGRAQLPRLAAERAVEEAHQGAQGPQGRRAGA
jgi:Lon protease-like protein